MRKEKVLFIAPFLSSFVQSDILILESEYHVITNIYTWRNKYLAPVYLFSQLIFLLNNISSTNKIIISFGGYWSLLPVFIGKVFKVPTFIVLHGTDCASIPSINYGSLRKVFVRLFCKKSYDLATVLLPVSSSLVKIENTYLNNESSPQGYKHYFPDNKTEYKIISNGLDEKFWHRSSNISKEDNSFIAVFSKDQFILKGGDLILELANRMKNYKFYIAGMSDENHEFNIPQNVYLLGKLPSEKLREYYCKCQFHLQLSIFEGFGLALCEAMLCECIPIGSSVNIIPEIIGKSGLVLQHKDIKALEKLTKEVIDIKDKNVLGKIARSQIIENYSLNKRKEELLTIINR
jgi:hypothetical protein